MSVHDSYDELVSTFKWILICGYILIAMGSLYELITSKLDKLKSSKPKYLHLIILGCATGMKSHFKIICLKIFDSSSWYIDGDTS